MITSSEFFKKSFFQIQQNSNISQIKNTFNLVQNNLNQTKNISKSSKKNKTGRYSHLNEIQKIQSNKQKPNKSNKLIKNKHKNIQKSQQQSLINSIQGNKNQNIMQRSNTKKLHSLQTTKNNLFNLNQLQLYHSHKKYNSSLDYRNIYLENKNIQQIQQVSPWNQQINYTSRQMYDMKSNIEKQRQKIKYTIDKYKWTNKTIDQNIKYKDRQHANFIKNNKSYKTKNKDKKVNYILYELNTKQNKNKQKNKQISIIKNIDLNQTYQKYLNHQLQINQDILKLSNHNYKNQSIKNNNQLNKNNQKYHTHSRQKLKGSRQRLKSSKQRLKSSNSLIQISQTKQVLQNSLKQDLKCCQYQFQTYNKKYHNLSKTKILNQYTSQTNQINKQTLLDKLQINNQLLLSNQDLSNKISQRNIQRNRIKQKIKNIKLQNNRRIFKGSKIALNQLSSNLNTKRNQQLQQQTLSLEVSGNKARKLQYSLFNH